MRVAVIVPALDEAENLPAVLRALPMGAAVIVVDGGSRDGTADVARGLGAHVVVEPRRGYGRACLAGVARASDLGADLVAFVDAAGTVEPADLAAVLAPLLAGSCDLAVGVREPALRERGALAPAQRAGNALACAILSRRTGQRFRDLGPMRAIGIQALLRLDMRELAHGWPAEMLLKAGLGGLRVVEVPVHARRRAAGRSKVSGSLMGSVRAGIAILRVVLVQT